MVSQGVLSSLVIIALLLIATLLFCFVLRLRKEVQELSARQIGSASLADLEDLKETLTPKDDAITQENAEAAWDQQNQHIEGLLSSVATVFTSFNSQPPTHNQPMSGRIEPIIEESDEDIEED